MATQRVHVFAIGGLPAERFWEKVVAWSDARTVTDAKRWSSDDWPVDVRREVDAFVSRMLLRALSPPILYRAEHLDYWSMGDVFVHAMERVGGDGYKRLQTENHELLAVWSGTGKAIGLDRNASPETVWLYCRLNEAMAAWGDVVERRLIVLIRSPIGGLVTDEEFADALEVLPNWWDDF